MSAATERPRGLRLVLLGWTLYALAFIARTSFTLDGGRGFCLFDDAMISMRYARNLARGLGAVWNPGEPPVEGFTSPLWTAFMAAVHLLPIPPSKTSLVIQLACLLIGLAQLVVVHRLAVTMSSSDGVGLAATVITACFFPLNNWNLQGMETGALTLVSTLAVGQLCSRADRFPVLGYVALLLGAWLRSDHVVFILVAGAAQLLGDRARRRQHLAALVLVLLVGLVLPTYARWRYYGALVPNTYALKLLGYPTSLRLVRGAYVTLRAAWQMNPLLWAVPMIVLLRRRARHAGLLVALILAQSLYAIFVGGDAWETTGGSRFGCVVMPLVFAVIAWGGALLTDELHLQRWRVPLVVFAAIAFNAYGGLSTIGRAALLAPPVQARSTAVHARLGTLLSRATSPSARIAVVAAGALPYFADRPCVDLLGKSDRHVAAEPMHRPSGPYAVLSFQPGHMKWDYAWSLGELRPDVVVELWDDAAAALPYLEPAFELVMLEGLPVYLRRDSPVISRSQLP